MRDLLAKRKFWIAVFVLILAVAGVYYAYNTIIEPATDEQATEAPVQIAEARRGDLTVFASAVGQVIPAAEIDLGFDQSGSLSELLVQVGDDVQEGQVLARLETDQTEEEIVYSIAQAELNLLQAQQALDEIYSSAEMDAATALQSVESAEQALEDLFNVDLREAQALQAIVEAEESVAEAQRAYNGVRSTASHSAIEAAYAELVLALDKLDDAKDKFKPYSNKPDDNLTKAYLQLKLSAAQGAYDSALRYYNALTGTGSELDKERTAAELATAEAELAEVRRQWELIKDGPTPGEIALAEAELAAAKMDWEILKNGPDPEEIALAEANLANAEANMDLAMEEQAVIDLIAPMDGTVMSITASVGEKVNSSPIITLADLSRPYLEIYLDETDMLKVGVGYKIEVVFDALPDEIFTGYVIEVDPSLQSVSGIQAVKVLAQMDADSYAKPQNLPVGLNASVDVIGGHTENAVLVPVEALREIGPEEYVVFVMENGEPKLRVVTVGLMDFTSAEIISGLEAGETVTTGIVQTE
jgi:RND family efflux transporter MFP subunit